MKKLLLSLLWIPFVCFLTGCAITKSSENPQKTIAEHTNGNEKSGNVYKERKGEIITDEVLIDSMAEDILDTMTPEEKIGQMFIINLEALDTSKGLYYEHRNFSENMKESLSKYGPGGVILFSRNIETREQTSELIKDLQKNNKIPLFVSVDEEGGDVARIAFNPNMGTTSYPSMWEVGMNKDTAYAYNMGRNIGKEIAELGFNLNFAPVADVKTNETNTEIGNRSFGNEPHKVANMVTAVVNGLQKSGVSATLKHFPGDGDVEGDTHDTAVNIDNDLNRLRTVDFVPFKEGIKAGADFVMVSHISISRIAGNTTPASLSNLVMKTILRKELGFKGIIITDAMDMKAITNDYEPAKAAVESILAGSDIVLLPADFKATYNGVYHAYANGKITEERLDESVLKILRTKVKRGLILSNTKLVSEKSDL